MQQFNDKELLGLDIEDIAKYKVLEMLSDKDCLTEEELYTIKEDFEDTFIKTNREKYPLEMILLNKKEINLNNEYKDIKEILNNTLYTIMDTYLDIAYSVYLDKLNELYENQFDYEQKYSNYDNEELEYVMENEKEFESPSIYFEDIEEELYLELDYTLNEVKNISLENKINEKIERLSNNNQELIKEDLENLIKDIKIEEISEDMADIILLKNSNLIDKDKEIEIIKNTREYLEEKIDKMRENIKEETLEDKLEKVNKKMNNEKIETTDMNIER